MTSLSALWLPILLSAVAVFILSSLIHMMSPWHKSDYPQIPREAEVLDAIRPFNIPAGDYMAPRPANMADMRSPEFLEKVKRGPRLIVTIMPGGSMSMTGNLINWFIYSIVVGLLSAAVVGGLLPPGTEYRRVFHFVAITAFMGYSLAIWQMSIWYSRSMSTTIKATVDGLIYALVTAGVFGWLWGWLWPK